MTASATAVPAAPPTPAWRYAIGMFGASLPINMIKGSVLFFYVDLLGMDVRAYGIVMTFYAILDAIDNPVLGWFSDRTRSRFGRRRPWLVVGATVLCACFVGFFSAPSSLRGAGLVIWFTFFALMCEAFDSMFSANYGALLPEIFPKERQRASANSMRQGFQLLAMVLSLAVTPLLTTKILGTEQSTIGFTRTAAIYAVLALVTMVFMAVSVHENPAYETEQRPGFFSSIWQIVRTRLFWTVGLASACYLIPLTLVMAGAQLYVKYSLGLPVSNALYLEGVVILFTAGLLVVWTRVVHAKGAPFVWRISFVVMALGFIPIMLAQNLLQAIGAGIVIGIGWSGLLASNDLIQARILDQDARQTGVHREGIYLSAFGFFGRLSGAVNGLALASLGAWLGYYSGERPGEHPGTAFRVYIGAWPLAIALIGALLSWVIKLPAAGAEPAVQALASEHDLLGE